MADQGVGGLLRIHLERFRQADADAGGGFLIPVSSYFLFHDLGHELLSPADDSSRVLPLHDAQVLE